MQKRGSVQSKFQSGAFIMHKLSIKSIAALAAMGQC